MIRKSTLLVLAVFCVSQTSAHGAIATVTFTKLTGVTGGSPAGTAVYRADLSGLGLSEIQSIVVRDDSSGLGGSPGQFSGFDLDAIVLSTTSVGSAAAAQALVGIGAFDFSPSGTMFTPGSQRVPPFDPKLFGTDAGGANVDNSVATLGALDANSSNVIPPADGFVSMGDDGVLAFNLTSAVSTTSLFMYIGEVGDNGEVAAGTIEVSDRPVDVIPEPHSFLVWSLMGMAGVLVRRRRSR